MATGGKAGVPLPIVLLVPAFDHFRIKVRLVYVRLFQSCLILAFQTHRTTAASDRICCNITCNIDPQTYLIVELSVAVAMTAYVACVYSLTVQSLDFTLILARCLCRGETLPSVALCMAAV